MSKGSSSEIDPEGRARVLALAEQALARIVSFDLLPDPITFAVWFTYFGGTHRGLCDDVDRLIARGGLTIGSLRAVHDRHLVPEPAGQRLLAAGEGLQVEARTVGTIIATAQSSATLYGDDLDLALRTLDRSDSDQAPGTTVARLVASTDRVRRTTEHLQRELARSEQQVRALRRQIDVIQAESLTDSVTAIGNRKLFDRMLVRMVEAAEGNGAPLALALADVDRFKEFNDQLGHQIGDDVLRLVAGVVCQHVRDADVVTRYGGDEFAILLPDTIFGDAVAVCERVRRAVGEKVLVRRSSRERLGSVSVSIGVAAHVPGDSPENLFRAADQSLLEAKRQGRNCVVG